MEEINVLFVVRRLTRTGPIVQLYNRIEGLKSTEISVDILTIDKEIPNNSMKENFKKLGTNLVSFEGSIPFYKINHKNAKRVVDLGKYAVIQSTGLRSSRVAYKIKKPNQILVLNSENYVFENYKYIFGNIKGFLFSLAEIYQMYRSDYVVCCSKYSKVKYQKYLNNIYYIPNSFNDKKFNERFLSSIKLKKIKKNYNLDKYQEIWMTVGTDAVKNTERAIETFLSYSNDKNSVILILGEGSLFDILYKKYKDNMKVIFVGNTSNVEYFMQLSDVYISASDTEGLPTAVLEASRMKNKLILSDIYQHRSIFDEKTSNEVIFTDFSEKLETIFKLNTQLNQINVVKLKEFVNCNYSSTRIAEKYREFYQLVYTSNEKRR